MPTLLDGITARIAADLSAEQRIVVGAHGRTVVIACPGSGKTKTVAYKVVRSLADWKSQSTGIAVLSFTNSAVDEIIAQIGNLGVNYPLPTPHFIGTIDSFFVQNLFRPFGHLVMGCLSNPQIVLPEQYSLLNDFLPKSARTLFMGKTQPMRPVQLARVVYLPSGDLDMSVVLSGSPATARLKLSRQLSEAKQKYAREGLATYSDALYWCFKLLSLPQYSYIKDSICARFQQWVLDEAQDTSDFHELLLNILWSASSDVDITVIGDPDQAIFEWNKAKPDYLLQLMRRNGEGWKSLTLSDNWRSSQHICNGTHPFRNPKVFGQPAIAQGPDAARNVAPYFLTFGASDYHILPTAMTRLWDLAGDSRLRNPEMAIVTWTHETEARIQGWDNGVPLTSLGRQLVESVALYRGGDLGKAFAKLENAICPLMFGRPALGEDSEWLPESVVLSRWLELVSSGMVALVDTASDGLSVADFAKEARLVLESLYLNLGLSPEGRLSSRLRVTSVSEGQTPLVEFLAPERSTQRMDITTVHRIKGATVDALMLVSGYDHETGSSDIEQWMKAPNPLTGICLEPRRIAYVAMTRPRKLLIVAAPNECSQANIRHADWARGGFEHISIQELIS